MQSQTQVHLYRGAAHARESRRGLRGALKRCPDAAPCTMVLDRELHNGLGFDRDASPAGAAASERIGGAETAQVAGKSAGFGKGSSLPVCDRGFGMVGEPAGRTTVMDCRSQTRPRVCIWTDLF